MSLGGAPASPFRLALFSVTGCDSEVLSFCFFCISTHVSVGDTAWNTLNTGSVGQDKAHAPCSPPADPGLGPQGKDVHTRVVGATLGP